MIRSKNYEIVFKFVEVMPRILVASFFGHGVDCDYRFSDVSEKHAPGCKT